MIKWGVESMMMTALNVSGLVGKGVGRLIAELLLCAQLLTHASCCWWVNWGSGDTISSSVMLHPGQQWHLQAKAGLISTPDAVLSSKQDSDALYAEQLFLCYRTRTYEKFPYIFRARLYDLDYCQFTLYCFFTSGSHITTQTAVQSPGLSINCHFRPIAW